MNPQQSELYISTWGKNMTSPSKQKREEQQTATAQSDFGTVNKLLGRKQQLQVMLDGSHDKR